MTDYTLHQDLVMDTSVYLACFFKKIQDWILNPKESKNRFCVSLLNRSIRDLSDHGALKEPKNSLSKVDSLVSLTHYGPKDLRLICLVKNAKSDSDSFGFMNPILDFRKELHC